MTALVGYKLVRDKDGVIISEWGGIYGQVAPIPNPLILPNGDQVCGARAGESYVGYSVVEWRMDPPPPSVADVNKERDQRIADGFLFMDRIFQSRSDDRENIAGAGTLASIAIMGGAQPGDYRWHGGSEDFVWIAADNSLIQMDAFDVVNFGKTAAAWKSAHIFAARALKDSSEIPSDYRDDARWPQRANFTQED